MNDTYLRRLTLFGIYFHVIINVPHLLSLFHPSFLLHTLPPSLRNYFSASILHPPAMGVGLSSPPPWFLASWRSLSCILKGGTLREMTTCVVTE